VYGMTSSPVLEQFQQKCAAVLRLELRKNKEIERFRDSEKSGNALDETTPPEPETLYGQVKLAAEEALKALATPGFVTASLRVTGVYGPAGPGRLHKWAGLFADYLAGRPVPPRIGTEVHGDDVAQAVRLMLEADAANVSGKVFNVSDVLTDSREILAIFQSVTGCPHALPQAADPTGFKVMSTERLRALGWMPGGRDRLAATIRELARDAR
ncbi:MAG TPA: NAD-dependent epimerase/dehydratase family protein, partial [Sinorhizobium sp.]|nr:NAD-dependent epimerase/dehydratase family protein [Sinorhizobium sp.]